MTRMTSRVLLALALAGASIMVAHAEELDEMLALEAETEVGVTTPATDEAPEQAPEPKGPTDVALMTRQALEQEVLEARTEVARLKDLVRRIVIANRREKVVVQYNMGCIYREGGHIRKAEKAFLEALRLDPQDPAVHYNLGILYDEDLRAPDRAREHYQRFLELAPNDPDAGSVYAWMTGLAAQ